MPSMLIAVKDENVRRLFERAPQLITRRLKSLVEASAIDVLREMRIAAPVAVTGQLRGSIRYVVSPLRIQAEIKPEVNYAEPVEYGTKPHLVSVAEGTPLRAWAKLKGINPYALQASIAKKGTKAHPFVEPTYRKMKPVVEADIAAGMTKLVGELNNAGV
jgi:Bacteriophage HK97-gp10, putative tail-component